MSTSTHQNKCPYEGPDQNAAWYKFSISMLARIPVHAYEQRQYALKICGSPPLLECPSGDTNSRKAHEFVVFVVPGVFYEEVPRPYSTVLVVRFILITHVY